MVKEAGSWIPRIIWQTYRSDNLPGKAAACRDSWLSLNPGWDYRFLDDAGIEAYVEEHAGSKLLDTFLRVPVPVMKADIWRYLALYKEGGLYTDIDTTCLEPVDDWLPFGADLVLAPENRVHLCQWTLLAAPGHDCLKNVLDLIVERAANGVDTRREDFVHFHTGPGVWTEAVLQSTGCPETDMVRLSRSGQPPCLRALKIHIFSQRYFRQWKVVHHFGSRFWKGGYPSWIKTRRQLSDQ